MFVELGAIGVVSYIGHRIKNKDFYKYKSLLNAMYAKESGFTNKLDHTPILKQYLNISYGDRLILDVSGIMSFEELEKKKDYISTYFKTKDVLIKRLNNGLIQLDLIRNEYSNKRYEPVKTKEHEVLCGYNREGEYIKVDMNKFPHLLIGGDTGTGKSRLMLLILTNLITQHNNIDIYLMQIRKGDLTVFKDCKQVKRVSRTLEEVRETLLYLDKICKERDAKIEDYIGKGIYNIEDWNRAFKYRQFKYVYVALEEFSFFNPSGADSKEEKIIKKEILGLIRNIVLVGRSVGVFILTSLQKPTSSSIPAEIKGQLCTRASFRLQDKETSIIVLGNGKASKLGEREVIIRTLGEQYIKTPYINHDIIMKYISSSIVKKKTKKVPKISNDGVIDLNLLNEIKV
ncbi:FtsK/SpoIIIE domain-containing protein [Clostridium sp. UBA2485]|uniref:FtsK/SpoIIIE domain-containing protein n=1 Tax=Clostridium sp. UBA2485 TaxID=1946352 RepID=UPI0025C6D1B2|nr:FtsK/SpoIIIE domain-containing protein [Clostridium sp. UBA2485]